MKLEPRAGGGGLGVNVCNMYVNMICQSHGVSVCLGLSNEGFLKRCFQLLSIDESRNGPAAHAGRLLNSDRPFWGTGRPREVGFLLHTGGNVGNVAHNF